MPERILVVDDNRDVADAYARLIHVFGYEPKTVYDSTKSVDEAAAFHPDMALIDIRMPGMDGYEVARRIRQQLGKEIVLVAVTGFAWEESAQRAFQAGFDKHVTKPLSAVKLKELLSMLGPSSGTHN
jgi:CheY-like chemotaxis protein